MVPRPLRRYYNILFLLTTASCGADETSTPITNPLVGYPVPKIARITPNTIAMQSSGGTLPITITGTGFVAQSTVRLGSSYVFPTSVAPTQIVANVPLITLGVPGTIQLTVFNPAPGGGPSNDVDFSVLYPVPTITVLSPDSNVTGAGFTLTVSGTGFATGIGTSSVVRWNGEDRPTTS